MSQIAGTVKQLLIGFAVFSGAAAAQLESYQGPADFVGKEVVDTFVAGTGLTEYRCSEQPYGVTCNLKATEEAVDYVGFTNHLLAFIDDLRDQYPEFGYSDFEREELPGEQRLSYKLNFGDTQPLKTVSVRFKYGDQPTSAAAAEARVYVSISAVAWPTR